MFTDVTEHNFFRSPPFIALKMESNIENIRKQKSTQIKPQFLLLTIWKCQKPQLINASFLSLRRCLQVYSWPRYAKNSQTEPGFLRNVYL